MSQYRSIPSWQFDKMWEGYPTCERERLRTTIGGTVAANVCRATRESDPYYNTCAVRLSHALNYAGYQLKPDRNDGLEVEAGARRKYFYAIKARQLREHIKLNFGTSLKIGKGKLETIRPFRGIIAFWWQGDVKHLDLWDGHKGKVRYNNQCFERAQKMELWATVMEPAPPR